MTEQELESQFTPADPILAAARQAILAQLDENIRRNHATGGKCGHDVKALQYAQYVIRDIIAQDGRVLKADIAKYMPPPEG